MQVNYLAKKPWKIELINCIKMLYLAQSHKELWADCDNKDAPRVKYDLNYIRKEEKLSLYLESKCYKYRKDYWDIM